MMLMSDGSWVCSRLRNFRKIVTRNVDNEEGDLKSHSDPKSPTVGVNLMALQC